MAFWWDARWRSFEPSGARFQPGTGSWPNQHLPQRRMMKPVSRSNPRHLSPTSAPATGPSWGAKHRPFNLKAGVPTSSATRGASTALFRESTDPLHHPLWHRTDPSGPRAVGSCLLPFPWGKWLIWTRWRILGKLNSDDFSWLWCNLKMNRISTYCKIFFLVGIDDFKSRLWLDTFFVKVLVFIGQVQLLSKNRRQNVERNSTTKQLVTGSRDRIRSCL